MVEEGRDKLTSSGPVIAGWHLHPFPRSPQQGGDERGLLAGVSPRLRLPSPKPPLAYL